MRSGPVEAQDPVVRLNSLAAEVVLEIVNPLTSILGQAQLLSESGPHAPAVADAAGSILQEALRCRRIVSTFSAFLGRDRIEPVDLDLTAMAANLALALRARHRTGDPAIDVAGIGNDCWIRGDRDLLGEAFANLVEGVVEERRSLGDGGQVVLACRRDGDHVIVEISHDRTSQAGRSPTTALAENSLLLRIARGILAIHDASLLVTSDPGLGWSLVVLFPAAQHRRARRGAGANDSSAPAPVLAGAQPTVPPAESDRSPPAGRPAGG